MLELTPLTVNTNLENSDEVYKTKGFHTSLGFIPGGKIKSTLGLSNPDNSEYKRVMERRKSRQSTFAPCTIDVDYVGDSAKYEHIIR